MSFAETKFKLGPSLAAPIATQILDIKHRTLNIKLSTQSLANLNSGFFVLSLIANIKIFTLWLQICTLPGCWMAFEGSCVLKCFLMHRCILHSGRQTYRQTGRPSMNACMQAGRQTGMDAGRGAGRQAGLHTDRQADRQQHQHP